MTYCGRGVEHEAHLGPSGTRPACSVGRKKVM